MSYSPFCTSCALNLFRYYLCLPVAYLKLVSFANARAGVAQAPRPGEGRGACVTQARADVKETNLKPKP